MINQKPQLYFFFSVLIGVAVFSFFIFKPFIGPLILALVAVAVFKPLHKRILAKLPQWESVAALLTLLAVVAFFVVPLVFLGMQIFQEAGQFYAYLSAGGGKAGVVGYLNAELRHLHQLFPMTQTFTVDVDQSLKQALEWLIRNLAFVFSDLAKILLSFFVFLIAFYYLLKDGARTKKFLISLSPLGDEDDEMIIKKLDAAANSVVKGRLLIALVQGVVSAIGFFIFGVPNPILWGSATALASLVPGVGTMLVFAPATLFLLATDGALPGFGLLAWGVGAVGLVDNLLAPKLLGRGTNLHPLLVLLSVLGGIVYLGPIGIFLGPLAISLLIALLDLHFLMSRGRRTE